MMTSEAQSSLDDSARNSKRRVLSAPVSPRLRAIQTRGTNTPTSYSPVRDDRIATPSGLRNRRGQRQFSPDASVVLVGIRGCGKRSLGFIAATALGRRFVTEDHYFQATTGLSRQDYLKIHGSEEFHKQDIDISRRMLEENKVGCVIDCGLGSLTSGLQDYLRTYSLTNPVVYLLRDMDAIKSLLKLGDRSAKLLENADPTHRRCSNYEFYNLEDETANSIAEAENIDRASPTYSFKLRELQADFSYFVKFITGSDPLKDPGSTFSLDAPIETRLFTHALRLPLSLYEDNKLDLSELEGGGDVIEVFVDRWQQRAAKPLSRMIADVRRHLQIPIMLSAARKSAGFTDDIYILILQHGLRLGVELISVDLELENRRIAELAVSKGMTRIVGTFVGNGPTAESWRSPMYREMVERASTLGLDIVRLMRVAKSRDDNDSLNHFTHEIQRATPSLPTLIAFNVGRLGRTSQVFNRVLTSVTHESLRAFGSSVSLRHQPSVTAYEATDALFSSFALDPLRFHVIGGNVSSSLSPAMHNAAYRLLGFRHEYSPVNVKSWEDIEKIARRSDFGGASVAQPWKVKIVDKLAHISEHARVIGAINTLVPLRSQPDSSLPPLHIQATQRNRAGPVAAWFGDNFDWRGISICLSRSLSPRNVIQARTTGLVIGAGGMARAACYSLLNLGCRNIFVYNRTVSNTEKLADHFNKWLASRSGSAGPNGGQVRVIQSLEEPWPSGYAMPTMIISCITHEHLFDGNTEANFTVPEQWLGSETGGAAVEQAFYRETPFVQHLKQYRSATNRPWVVVNGMETLHEQGLAQFEIMTGRKAPRKVMWNALMKALQKDTTVAMPKA